MRLSPALSAVAIILGGCAYWYGTPAGDTAPASWSGVPSRAAMGRAAVSQQAPTASSVVERLRNLEQLRRDGLIGEAEYRERRKRALAEEF